MPWDFVQLAVAGTETELERAKKLARHLGVSFLGCVDPQEIVKYPYLLWCDHSSLSLRATGSHAPGPVRCDIATGAARHRRLFGGGKSQAIARAVGLKSIDSLWVADLTAGLGQDAFVLASLGARVTLVERHPVVHELLRDGLLRAAKLAAEDPALASILARMELAGRQDGLEWLEHACEPAASSHGDTGVEFPDVIYLDPMFPERSKHAKVKKTMTAFHFLVGPDADAQLLLPAALATPARRVVVKRSARAPFLNDQRPSYSLDGKSVRFDVYPLRALTAR